MGYKWNKDRVNIRKSSSYRDADIIKSIISYHIKGANLNYKHILHHRKQNKRLMRLAYVAERHFHGWYNALDKAGIDSAKFRMKKRWSRKKIANTVKDMYAAGEPLNNSYMEDCHNDLYSAANYHYKSWRMAVESILEINYSLVMVRKAALPLSKKAIVKRIKLLHQEGARLNASNMFSNPEHRPIYIQASYKFKGGYDEALSLAGLDPLEIRLRRSPYTDEELKEMTYKMLKEGKNLSTVDVNSDNGNKKLYAAAQVRYDSWYDFLDSIGIDSSKYILRRDSKNGRYVIEYLKHHYPDGIVTGATCDKNFAAVMRTYYGTIRDAVKEAGMIYSRRGKISKQQIREDPSVAGALYRFNKDFLHNIASTVYWFCRKRRLKTLEIRDLEGEAFIRMLDLLPGKPPKMKTKEFMWKPIFSKLMQMNKDHFKESYYEDVKVLQYLDAIDDAIL